MSWAAHNPEKYDEICRQGIVRYLIKHIPELESLKDDLDYLLDQWSWCNSNDAEYRLWDRLISIARQEISEAEREYFADLTDAAMNRVEAYRETIQASTKTERQ